MGRQIADLVSISYVAFLKLKDFHSGACRK